MTSKAPAGISIIEDFDQIACPRDSLFRFGQDYIRAAQTCAQSFQYHCISHSRSCAISSPWSPNGELVLIADDQALVLEVARLALESASYRVLQAGDDTEALALAIEHKNELKLAIMDNEMPYLGGPATIRTLHKAIPSLKIVQISGSAGDGESSDTARAGDHPLLQNFYLASPQPAASAVR